MKFWSFLVSLRPMNWLLVVLSHLMILYYGSGTDWLKFFSLITLPIVLVMISGYLINNYLDKQKDTVNAKRNRPEISRSMLFSTSVILNLSAFLLSSLYDYRWCIVVMASSVLLYLYARIFSNWPLVGNFIVALLSTLSVGVILWVSGDFSIEMESLYILLVLIFGISLKREMIKDIEDIEGDHQSNAQTLPILMGVKFTKAVISVLQLAVSFFLFFWARYWFDTNSTEYAYLLILAIFGLILTVYLIWAKNKKEYHRLSSLYKLYMFLGLIIITFIP